MPLPNPRASMNRWLLLALLPVCAGSAYAQKYPDRPVRVIVAQSAGSSMDTITRIVTNRMAEQFGQQFVIDNRGGASGIIGVELASRATPDGYTLLIGAPSSMIIANFTYRSLPFDWRRDFAPISPIVDAEGVLVVNPAVAARSVKELLALAKAQPGKLNMASAGIGSSSHLAGVMFTSMAGIDSVHVPYKGGGPMAAAVVANEAQWLIAPAASVAGQIKGGRLRALGITSKRRSPLMPEVPTIDEAGVSGYEYTSWNAMFAPRKTPRDVIVKLHGVLQKILNDAEVRQQYAVQGLSPLGSASPDEFEKFYYAEYDRVARVVKIAGVKPE
jgi:tripartite-type tricarboxylate transporter receptor subunit TctC